MTTTCQTAGAGASTPAAEQQRISLAEILDRVLNKGVVVCGEVVISVADIDLVYLGLQLVLTSIDKARASAGAAGEDAR